MVWLTGWNYQKQLYISSTNSLSSYQMKITVNYGSGTDETPSGNIYCGGNCNNDFSDIRFTDSTGNTKIYYWIESYISSSSATIWIKIPSISIGSSTYIYFYYGNSTPPSDGYNSGINTFIAFFDFETDTVGSLPSGWTSSGGTTVVVANDHTAESSSKSLKIVEGGSNGQWHSSLLGGGNVPYNNYTVEFWVYSTGNHYIFMGTTPTQSAYTTTWGYIDIRSGVDRWWWKDGTAGPGYSPYNNGVWHHVVATHNSSNIQSVFVDGTNLNVDYNYTSDANFNVANLKYFSGLGGTTGGTIWVDNIFIRNFVSTEPTWGPIGTGSLSIASTPSGAEIYLNNIDQNTTTTSLGTTISNLAPDAYNILLRLTGYADWTGTATVSSGMTTSISATLSITPWLSVWNDRKQLYISGTTAGNQVNYQMKLTVNYGSGTDIAGSVYCNSKCKADFSDIRFTDSAGNQLNYWVESYTSGSIATIWIQIPSIPTGSNSVYIYFYYNNPSATDASNGNNTFVLYTGYHNTSYVSPTLPITGAGYAYTNVIRITHSQTQGDNVGFGFGDSTNRFPSNSILCELYGGYTGKWYLWRSYAGGVNTNQLDTTTPAYSYGVTYRYEIVYASSSSAKLYRDGTQIGTTMTSGLPTSPIGIFINIGDTTGYQNSYYQFIRRYASPEPTWSSTIGAEQGSVTLNISSNPSGGEIWLNTPSGTSNWADQHITTPSTIYVQTGSYDIMVGVGGYQQWYLTNVCSGICAAGSTWNINANPILLPGSIAMYSTPSGASIYLDGSNTPSGTTALGGTTISNLSVGSHSIRLSLIGYIDWTGNATVNTQDTTIVRAVFAGSANISSTPTNSSIYLDGSPTSIGNTTLTITNLTPTTSDGTQPTQSHTYVLKLTGYADISGSFTATAGSTINVPVTFPGSLNITSVPVGAQIYIDGILQ